MSLTLGGLGRTAMAAAVVGDHPIAFLQEEKHLGVPVVAAERPSVMEDDGLGVFRTPVLVENVRAVLGLDRAHGVLRVVGRSNTGSMLQGAPGSPCRPLGPSSNAASSFVQNPERVLIVRPHL